MKNGIVIERSFRATLDEIWELWTTKEGIEAWWGPDGFRVEVAAIVLRTGGYFEYAMIAVAPEMIELMKGAGMKTRTDHRNTFTEVTPKSLLAWTAQADFIPGVKPYPIETRVELRARGDEVKVTLMLSHMHDEMWTGRQRMGWETQLVKLERLLSTRKGANLGLSASD
jgi:uncharacterized protein YndB with AHSA1/START domain